MVKYTPDILQNGFEKSTLSLKNDYEGKVTATLIRKKSKTLSGKAILYIHGFNDYFFQEEMAEHFNVYGFNFYALDLRKYGRSYLPHQKFNDIRNLKDYYEEIQKGVDIIREEGNEEIILMGHSTGGLILTLFAKEHTEKGHFHGLILNSPFFEFNKNKMIRMLLPLAALIGHFLPKVKIAGGFTEMYGLHLNKNYKGEWRYNLLWKPNVAPKINLGWIRAIHKGQKELKKKFEIAIPVLVLHSNKSVENEKDVHQIRTRDAILNVEHIKRVASNIVGNSEIISIKGGLHDLILSEKGVREKVYDTIFDWIKRQNL